MRIMYTGPQITAAFGELLQAQLTGYDNVEVEINLVDTAQYVASLQEGQFDIAFFTQRFSHPLTELQDFFRTGGARNFGGYSNPDVDQLLDDANVTVDATEQAELLAQAQAILVGEDAVAYILLTSPNYFVTQERVRDLHYAVDGIFLFDRVWLAPDE
jgi:peptide/nickel transport system substrate-binding protein